MHNDIQRLFDIPYFQAKQNSLTTSFCYKKDAVWKAISTDTLLENIHLLSKVFIEMGINPGDNIAIVTQNNGPEWHFVDYALQQIGAVTVPIYPTLSAADVSYIFSHAEVKHCFVGHTDLVQKMHEVSKALPHFGHIYTFGQADDASENALSQMLNLATTLTNDALVSERKAAVKATDLVTIIYTSGTTGNPKGVMLSHQNLLSNMFNTIEYVPLKCERALSFLPICHVFERMGIYLYQYLGFEIYFAESVEKLSENAQEIHPHIMTVVPRLLEKVYDKIMNKAHDLKGIKHKLFFWALDLGEQFQPFEEQSWFYEKKLQLARKLIFSKWQAALGGQIKGLICGSAALQPRLIRIFSAAGIPVLEGYGMTEASPIISANKLDKSAFGVGSCGKLLNNMTLKIAEDGEILVKGDNIMMGYYHEPQLTAEAFTEDGFFRTGDIGHLSEQGLLCITDRKKEMFKTSGGKYIAPQVIETKMKSSKFIEQIMVVGANQKMACALIQPDFEFIKSWIQEKGFTHIDLSNYKNMLESKEVVARINKAVAQINENLGKWEQIKKITLIPEAWSVDLDLLTPTLKLKRNQILKRYFKEYELMYKG